MVRILSISLLVGVAPAFAASPVELTRDEFKMYRHYLNALEDPRVQKMKPEARMGAIAKDAGFKLKELEKAVTRGESAGDVKALCEANIKEELGKGPLGARLGTVEVDVSDPHAVAYVMWLNESAGQLEEEASALVAMAQPSCPILSTFQVWANDKSAPNTRIFQALISSEAAARINVAKVKDFADTRYIRLFEKVKNAANGDVIEVAADARK